MRLAHDNHLRPIAAEHDSDLAIESSCLGARRNSDRDDKERGNEQQRLGDENDAWEKLTGCGQRKEHQ